MRPIRLHLDSSDYAAMYAAAPGTHQARVREHLKGLADKGQIAIGLSYHVVFEFASGCATAVPRRSSCACAAPCGALRSKRIPLLAEPVTGDDASLKAEDRAALQILVRDLKTFRSEITSPDEMNKQVPRWEELMGKESARVAAQIFQALHREKRDIKRSDATDFIHAMYLPHADLWRGTRRSAIADHQSKAFQITGNRPRPMSGFGGLCCKSILSITARNIDSKSSASTKC